MVIQSTADTGQISAQLLTTVTALLLAAVSWLFSKARKVDGNLTTSEEPEE